MLINLAVVLVATPKSCRATGLAGARTGKAVAAAAAPVSRVWAGDAADRERRAQAAVKFAAAVSTGTGKPGAAPKPRGRTDGWGVVTPWEKGERAGLSPPTPRLTGPSPDPGTAGTRGHALERWR